MPDFILFLIMALSTVGFFLFLFEYNNDPDRVCLIGCILSITLLILSSFWFDLAISSEEGRVLEITELPVITAKDTQFVEIPNDGLVNVNQKFGKFFKEGSFCLYKKLNRWSYGIYLYSSSRYALEILPSETSTEVNK